jgi:hypothetical protein
MELYRIIQFIAGRDWSIYPFQFLQNNPPKTPNAMRRRKTSKKKKKSKVKKKIHNVQHRRVFWNTP